LGDRVIFTTPVAAGCAAEWLPVFPFLALRLTWRKMMLIHLIDLNLPAVFGLIVPFRELLPVLVTTMLFVLLGLVIFALAYMVIDKVTPFSVRKELEEDHNVALAIVIASVILGTALIIAAAIHG